MNDSDKMPGMFKGDIRSGGSLPLMRTSDESLEFRAGIQGMAKETNDRAHDFMRGCHPDRNPSEKPGRLDSGDCGSDFGREETPARHRPGKTRPRMATPLYEVRVYRALGKIRHPPLRHRDLIHARVVQHMSLDTISRHRENSKNKHKKQQTRQGRRRESLRLTKFDRRICDMNKAMLLFRKIRGIQSVLPVGLLIFLLGTGILSGQETNPFHPAAPGGSLEGCLELKYDNGNSEGKQSYGGSCPAIQFFLSDLQGGGPGLVLKGFKLYASRYGGGFNPASTYVYVYIINSRDQVLQKAAFPYSLFDVEPKWIDLLLKDAVSIIQGETHLTIVIDPEAQQTKGIYFHYNKNPQKSHSLVATLGKGYKNLPDREWMIRAFFQPGGMSAPTGLTAPQAMSASPNEPPKILATVPLPGATNVDPSLTEISVTFDRDMSEGMSWTGGPPDFPDMPEGGRAQWRDKRTCVLPVKLSAGRKYRVGINAPSFKNFRSVEGIPAESFAIIFSTQGYTGQEQATAQKPVVVSMNPANGATNVDSNLKELRVIFNVPMQGGLSWVGGGPNFPEIPQGQRASWLPDKMTCVLPVQLKPNWKYQLGLNSQTFTNFRSEAGVPLDPVAYGFTTGQ